MAPSKTGEQDPEARAQAEKKLGLRYLLSFAGPLKGLLYLGCGLSALSMLFSFGPFVCIWLVGGPPWSNTFSSPDVFFDQESGTLLRTSFSGDRSG